MDTQAIYCSRCWLRIASQEKRVVQNGQAYHSNCHRPEEIRHTVHPQEGALRETTVQRLPGAFLGRNLPQ